MTPTLSMGPCTCAGSGCIRALSGRERQPLATDTLSASAAHIRDLYSCSRLWSTVGVKAVHISSTLEQDTALDIEKHSGNLPPQKAEHEQQTIA